MTTLFDTYTAHWLAAQRGGFKPLTLAQFVAIVKTL